MQSLGINFTYLALVIFAFLSLLALIVGVLIVLSRRSGKDRDGS